MTTQQLRDARRARAQLADAQDKGSAPRDPRDRFLDALDRQWFNAQFDSDGVPWTAGYSLESAHDE